MVSNCITISHHKFADTTYLFDSSMKILDFGFWIGNELVRTKYWWLFRPLPNPKLTVLFFSTPNRKPNYWCLKNLKFSTLEYQLSPVTNLGLTPQIITSSNIS
jgi:hypothetical protein